MPASIQIYGNANAVTRTVTVEFLGDIMAGSFTPVSTASEYFIRFTPSGNDTDGGSLPVKLVTSLSDLALNDAKWSSVDSSNAYPDIKTMVTDYIYDYIYGHTADQYSSGCAEQKPMAF